jgi:hypothetical protein
VVIDLNGVLVSGTPTCEHILGHTSLWRVQKIIAKNIHFACKYVVHVYCSCWDSDGIVRTSKMSDQLPAHSLDKLYEGGSKYYKFILS